MASSARLSVVLGPLLLTLLAPAALPGSGDANGAPLTAWWDDNSNGVATTRVERRLGTDTVFVAIADVPPGLTTYLDASVDPGSTYCYRALAWDADGVSPYSDEACATSSYDGYDLSVSVSKAGTGDGTVTSTPAGIDCGSACSATYSASTTVTLTATPAPGSAFDGWSGGCAGTNVCTFAGNTPVTVTATFSPVFVSPTPVSYTLTVAKSGPGAVMSSPAGINCGSDCSEAFSSGTLITLTAKPNKNGVAFAGWSGGGCSGSSLTCLVSPQAATTVSATFKNGKGK